MTTLLMTIDPNDTARLMVLTLIEQEKLLVANGVARTIGLEDALGELEPILEATLTPEQLTCYREGFKLGLKILAATKTV